MDEVLKETAGIKAQMEEIKTEMISETAFTHLKDFLMIFEFNSKSKENGWVEKENIKDLVALIQKVIDEEGSVLEQYIGLEDEYNHLMGSALAGHAHTHKFGSDHEHN